jgi:hypothetical protein
MPRTIHPWEKPSSVSFYELFKPALEAMNAMPELESRGNRPLNNFQSSHLFALTIYPYSLPFFFKNY